LPPIDWKRIFGKDHNIAENKILRTHASVQNGMSAFNNFSLSKLHDSTLGIYTLAKIGSVTYNKGTR